MSLIRSATTVGGATLASRVLGFVRDVMVAAVIGTGPMADAFFVALRLPNMFRSIFAEGAFNSAFVPLFAKRHEGDGANAARLFAEQAMSVLLATLLGITVLAMICMPWVISVLAPGFSEEPGKFSLAVEYARVTFPYLLLISLTALQSGVLNSLDRFFPGAAAPILLNICLISALLILVPIMDDTGLALSWGVAVAGVAQFAYLSISCARAGMALRLRVPRLNPDVRRLVRLGVPGVISGGIMQINLTIGTIIASLQAGAVSWLYYADRLYQLPLGVVGIAIGVVLLPDLSRRLRAKDDAGALYSQNRAIEFALLLTLPAAIALSVIPNEIIGILFERGAFDAADRQATAAALIAYAAGLPAFVLVKVFTPSFFARENTATPMKFAAISVAVNVATSFILFYWIGFVGIAIGTTVAAWTNTAMLVIRLRQLDAFKPDARLTKRVPLILLAAAGMGGVLWIGHLFAPGWLLGTGLEHQIGGILLLAVLIGAGGGAYLAFCHVSGAMRLSEIKASFRRG